MADKLDAGVAARSGSLTLREAAGLAVIGLLYGLLSLRFWFVSDDAFISFRYARNWAQGLGLRFNPGEDPPVEGYSNFLWAVACAMIELFGGDPELWAPLVSIGCGIALLVVVFIALRDRLGFGREVSLLATLSLALFPPFAAWGTGGLETMPFALALFLTFERLVLRKEPAWGVAAVSGLALSLLRTEGICWALLIGILALATRSGEGGAVKRIGIYGAIVVASFAVYFAARYAYYQVLFPNPVYLKVSFGWDVLLRGYRYVALFFLTFLTPFVLIPGAIVALIHGPLRLVFPVAVMAFAVPAYAVVVGGDWMIMGRFLVPGLAFQTLLLGWLLSRLWEVRPLGRAWAAAVTGFTVGIGLLPAWELHLVPESIRSQYRYMYSHPGFRSEMEEWKLHREGVAYAKEIGIAFRKNARSGESVVVGGIGAIGFYSDLFIYDRFGLVSPGVADRVRSEGFQGPLRSPGHDVKVSRDFFLDVQPTYLVFDVIDSESMRSRVLDEAKAWRALGSLWRRYAPDFFILDGQPLSETHRVLIVFRAIEDDPARDVGRLTRSVRRRIRAERAEEVWQEFYTRAAELRDR